MDSDKLSSVIFLDNYKMAISKMDISKLAYFCCLAPMQHFVAQLHSITIFEDNRNTFRFTTGQQLRIHCPGHRRLPKLKNLLLVNVFRRIVARELVLCPSKRTTIT